MSLLPPLPTIDQRDSAPLPECDGCHSETRGGFFIGSQHFCLTCGAVEAAEVLAMPRKPWDARRREEALECLKAFIAWKERE